MNSRRLSIRRVRDPILSRIAGVAILLGASACREARGPVPLGERLLDGVGPKCVHPQSDPNVPWPIASGVSMEVCDEPGSTVQSVDEIVNAFAPLACPSGFTSHEGWIECTNLDREIRTMRALSGDETSLSKGVVRRGGYLVEASLDFRTTAGNSCSQADCKPLAEIEMAIPLAFLSSSGYHGVFCGYASCDTGLIVKVAVREGRARTIRMRFDGLVHCALPEPGANPDASWPDTIHRGLVESLRRPGPWNDAAVSRLTDYYRRVWQLLQGTTAGADNGPQCVPYPR
jgi:hypothetical protein